MRHEAADLLLRLGISFAFLFASIDRFFNPFSWIGYVPPFFGTFMPEEAALYLFGVIGIVLAVWILSGKKIFWPSVFAAVLLLANVALNAGEFDILFRDVTIAAMALALAVAHRPARARR